MKRSFPFKDLKSIEIDRENDKIIAIYEEEKPHYTNQYGTNFFNGDQFFFIDKEDGEIMISKCKVLNSNPSQDYAENRDRSEAMTEKECYQHKLDNWDKFKAL